MAEAHDRPGEPPEVRDEAADTPMWVPAVGLALLILGAVFLVWQSSTERSVGEAIEQAVEGEPAAEEEGAAEEGAAEEGAAEEADAPEPAADPHAGHGH